MARMVASLPMGQPAAKYVSFEDFLISEANDPTGVRREWVDGVVFAMAGATPRVDILVSSLVPCRPAFPAAYTSTDVSMAGCHRSTMNVSPRQGSDRTARSNGRRRVSAGSR